MLSLGARTNCAIAIAVCAVGLGAGFLMAIHEPEPSYQGRSLRFWLAGFHPSRSPQDRQESLAAITRMGNDGLSALTRILESRNDSRWRAKAKAVLSRFAILKGMDLVEVRFRKEQAAWAFQALGASARAASPRLVAILDRSQTPEYVAYALAAVDPAACIQLLRHRDLEIRRVAADALGASDSDTDNVLSALEQCLEQDDDYLPRIAKASIDRIMKRSGVARDRETKAEPGAP